MEELNIFISHYHRDVSIAKKLKECIDTLFLQVHEIFLSVDIPLGTDWLQKITDFLKKKSITLVLTTPDSLKRPWVWFEVGASWHSGNIVIPICFRGITKSKLPEPLSRLQYLSIHMVQMKL